MDTPSTKERPAQAWPSPWPYDFPTGGKVPEAPDKVARVTQAAEVPLQVTRRSLFGAAALGWGAFLGANAVGGLGMVRFLFPTVPFEPPMVFRTQPLSGFAANSVTENWKETNAVWMVNVDGKILAISTVCTHLGCTPNWLEAEQKFKCPCHGSGFYKDGINFEGPAPRPLERYAISIASDGQIEIDKSRTFQEEMGQWKDSDSYVPV